MVAKHAQTPFGLIIKLHTGNVSCPVVLTLGNSNIPSSILKIFAATSNDSLSCNALVGIISDPFTTHP